MVQINLNIYKIKKIIKIILIKLIYFPIIFLVALPYLNTKYETKKNLKNRDKKEKITNWNIFIPIIPDPKQVIL